MFRVLIGISGIMVSRFLGKLQSSAHLPQSRPPTLFGALGPAHEENFEHPHMAEKRPRSAGANSNVAAGSDGNTSSSSRSSGMNKKQKNAEDYAAWVLEKERKERELEQYRQDGPEWAYLKRAAALERQQTQDDAKVNSSNLVADRRDAPAAHSFQKASKQDALAVCSTIETREAALQAYHEDKFSKSSAGSAKSWFGTWTQFHQEWFGVEPVLPLTPRKIACIGSMFKAGRYRSFGNYLSAAKNRHISNGFRWTEQHVLEASAACRSVPRGLGPAKQSLPLPLLQVHMLRLSSAPLTPSGPTGPGRMIVIGYFFIMREIEISLQLC